MVVRALGYTDNCNELKNMTWPTNFKVKAAELKLLNKVKSVAGGADRGGVAQLLYNALEAKLVTVTTDGDVTFIFDTIEGEKEAQLLLSRLADKVRFFVNSNHVDSENKDYKGDLVDLSEYMYQEITAYEKDDEVVFINKVHSLTFTGTVTGVEEGEITVENADEDEYTFKIALDEDDDYDVDFMYNGEDAVYEDEVLTEDEAKVTVVLKGESGDKVKDNLVVLAIVATEASGYVRVADVYEDGDLLLDSIYLPKKSKAVDFNKLTVKGDADSLEDIEEDDVVAVFVPLKDGDDDYFEVKAANMMTLIVARETVEGKVTKKTGSDYYIGGKAYKWNDEGDDIAVGDEGVFFLDHNGKVFGFDEEGKSTPGNYALVLDKTDGYKTASDGVVLAEAKVKLLTAAGEKITYVINKKAYTADDATEVVEYDSVEKALVVNLEEGDVIEYKLNSDKEVNKILNVYEVDDHDFDTVKTNAKSFKLAKSAVLFNVPDEDYEDASVVTRDDLDPKEITAAKIMDGTEIVVLLVSEGIEGETGTYALITKNNGEAYDEDEEENVTLYTAYVDGKKVEYLAHADATEDPFDVDFFIVELKLSNGKLKDVSYPGSEEGYAVNKKITDSITYTDDPDDEDAVEEVIFLADDVVIYVLKFDKDDNLTFDKVGAKSDIRGKYFEAYDVFGDNDGDFDIVVVFPADFEP